MPQEKTNDPVSCDGSKPVPLSVGTILNGQFKIVELTSNHPILGIQYNAIGKKGENYQIKMDGENNLMSLVRSEATFLHSVVKACASQHFVDFVHGGRVSNMIYLVTQFRPGPTLNDCLCAIPDSKFSTATSSRAAYFILQAIEWVHKLNYLMRRIDPNVIKYDVEDRFIYLSDLSSVRCDPSKLNVTDVKVKWAGAQIYAPMEHHSIGTSFSMQCKHDIEPLLYFLVEMTTGTLPWSDSARDKIATVKQEAITNGTLFNKCPDQYKTMHSYLRELKGGTEVDYKFLYTKLEECWKTAGARSQTDDPWDWEEMLKMDQ